MLLNIEVGTAVTVNFLADAIGGPLIIGLDGSNITTVNTYNASTVLPSDCIPVSWSSGNLQYGTHAVAANVAPSINGTNMDLHNFVYVPYLCISRSHITTF